MIEIRYGDTNPPIPVVAFWNEDDSPKDLSGASFFLEVRKQWQQDAHREFETGVEGASKLYVEENILMWLIDRYEFKPTTYAFAIKMLKENKFITVHQEELKVLPELVKK